MPHPSLARSLHRRWRTCKTAEACTTSALHGLEIADAPAISAYRFSSLCSSLSAARSPAFGAPRARVFLRVSLLYSRSCTYNAQASRFQTKREILTQATPRSFSSGNHALSSPFAVPAFVCQFSHLLSLHRCCAIGRSSARAFFKRDCT